MEEKDIIVPQVDTLFEKVSILIDQSRKQNKTAETFPWFIPTMGLVNILLKTSSKGIIGLNMGRRFCLNYLTS